MVTREQLVANGNVPQHAPFLVGFFNDLGVRRIILKCDNEPSTKSLQNAVVQACAGVEVIPQGALEGDHMADGRVEMAVREVKRHCKTLRISAEQAQACASQMRVRHSAGLPVLQPHTPSTR